MNDGVTYRNPIGGKNNFALRVRCNPVAYDLDREVRLEEKAAQGARSVLAACFR